MSSQRPVSEANKSSVSLAPPVTTPLVTEGLQQSSMSEPAVRSAPVERTANLELPEDREGNPLPEFVHQYLRDYIALADQKAGFVFAAVSAILAYLVSKDVLQPSKLRFRPAQPLGGEIMLLCWQL